MHEGFLDLASQIFGPLSQEIAAHPEVTRVTVAGHSLYVRSRASVIRYMYVDARRPSPFQTDIITPYLQYSGGAIAPLICAHLRSRLSPNVTLEYVAFAGPMPGDQAFADSLDAMPNLRPRRVMYLGSGLKHPTGPYGTCIALRLVVL